MCITPRRTSKLVSRLFRLSLLAVACLLPVFSARGAEVVIPTIVTFSTGYNDSVWGSEVRVINRTAMPKRFAVVDWIGAPNFGPKEYEVAPGAVLSLGGWQIYNYQCCAPPSDSSPAGVAILEVDDGLLVQSVVLSGVFRLFADGGCAPWNGGFPSGPQPCNWGAGPIVDGINGFVPAGQELFLPWLHTDRNRRTNILLVNPDTVTSNVTIDITSQDGKKTVSAAYRVGPHSLMQLNQIFSKEPFIQIRDYHETGFAAAAYAVIHADTRLYAVGYVISNDNNTETISLPR
jgi:hypothetical protein